MLVENKVHANQKEQRRGVEKGITKRNKNTPEKKKTRKIINEELSIVSGRIMKNRKSSFLEF